MSATSTPTNLNRGQVFTDWWSAWIMYVASYSIGTIALDLAEPTQSALAYPAFGLAFVVWAAEKSRRVPGEVTSWMGTWVPILVAAVVIFMTA